MTEVAALSRPRGVDVVNGLLRAETVARRLLRDAVAGLPEAAARVTATGRGRAALNKASTVRAAVRDPVGVLATQVAQRAARSLPVPHPLAQVAIRLARAAAKLARAVLLPR